MIQSQDFIASCVSRGYTFYTGVPCSVLKPLINSVLQTEDLDYVASTSEGEAVGIAAGAKLAGSKAVVMCQNSGLGNMINPLTSLCFPFRMPILLIITLRGEPGLNDEPQHELMGQITGDILDTLRIPWDFFPDDPKRIDTILNQAEDKMAETNLPFALIMRKGNVAKTDLRSFSSPISENQKSDINGFFSSNSEKQMSRMEAIGIIRKENSQEDILIATTGKIGRELFTLGDSENQLYIVGSMGCASGIGFGVQRVRSKKLVIVLDGDGAALMKMGTIATVGYYKPKRFIHIVLDNETYESTGGQYSVSPAVDFCKVAEACGYAHCYRVDAKEDLLNAFNFAKKKAGTTLIHVKVSSSSAPDLGRPTLKPYQVKERFMKFLKSGGGNV